MLQILRLPLKQVSAKQSARAAASAAPVAAVGVSAGTSRCRVVMSDDDDFEPVPAEHKRKKVICFLAVHFLSSCNSNILAKVLDYMNKTRQRTVMILPLFST